MALVGLFKFNSYEMIYIKLTIYIVKYKMERNNNFSK